ncbi:hypothetical protein BDW68DRAFT_172277 [Aspergillus falconensis]
MLDNSAWFRIFTRALMCMVVCVGVPGAFDSDLSLRGPNGNNCIHCSSKARMRPEHCQMKGR